MTKNAQRSPENEKVKLDAQQLTLLLPVFLVDNKENGDNIMRNQWIRPVKMRAAKARKASGSIKCKKSFQDRSDESKSGYHFQQLISGQKQPRER